MSENAMRETLRAIKHRASLFARQSEWSNVERALWTDIEYLAEHAEATDRRFAMIADVFEAMPQRARNEKQEFVDDVRGTKP